MTRLELATSTLARWRSTRWATSAFYLVPPDGIEPSTRGFSVPCSTYWATEAYWRPEWGSNPRPLAWQASVLTNWTTRPKWWEQQGSNLWPSACKADALPAELCSHMLAFAGALTLYLTGDRHYINTTGVICQDIFLNFFKFFEKPLKAAKNHLFGVFFCR